MLRITTLFLITASAALASSIYSVDPIALPAGYGLVSGVNASGQVATTNTVGGVSQAFIASLLSGTPDPLPSGWTSANGAAINDAGQIAGSGQNSTAGNQAFIGTGSGSSAIPYASGSTYAIAQGISSSGQVTGLAIINGTQQAFIGTTSGSSGIPIVAGYTGSLGNGVNSSGQVAGEVFDGSGNQEAFIGSTSGSALIPLPSGYSQSEADAINDAGQVAGEVWIGTAIESGFRAFIGSSSGATLIPLPAGATYTDLGLQSINSSSVVVGNSDAGAWIWDATDGTVLLNTLLPAGWNFDAFSISNSGIIMGLATFDGGASEYVELTPNASAPEPAAWLLTASGLGLLGLTRRYRRR